ncbi:MAG: MBL fold metallo-hydrolase [Gemmatimonadales bacterium]
MVLASIAVHSTALAQAPVQFAVSDAVSSCLVVHARPQSSAPPIACLAAGTRVEAVGTAPYWRQIVLQDGRTGWAAKKFLAIVAAPPVAPTTDDRDDAWLEINVVDVGQGDGIWIHTFDDNIPGNGRYEGYNIIIDGGPNQDLPGNRLLRYVMDKAHERAIIDALIVTHPHDDHYPGAVGILKHFDVHEFYDSGFLNGGDWNQFRALVDSEKFDGRRIVEHVGRSTFGMPDWGSELQVTFLYADPGELAGLGSAGTGTRINNASIVFRLQYGTQSMLFMGDIEGKEREAPPSVVKYAERLLLDAVDSTALRSTVLKVAHHGSETSSTTRFIDAVDPHYVVVSSGRRPYGKQPNIRFLPDKGTLQRYCAHSDSIRIYRTDQDDEAERKTAANDADGDNIVISMNGKETRIQAYSAGNPITPTACVP